MHQHIIRFSHPAENYISGLPVGNGRLAAMVCGGAERVRIALNHEWLWRGQIVELDERIGDCDLIYTSQDVELVRALIEKYGISYIYVGNLERERYPELNEDVLAGLGKNVFSDGEGTYILKVGEDLPSAEAPVQTESAPQS